VNRKGSSPPGVGASQASDPWPAPQVGSIIGPGRRRLRPLSHSGLGCTRYPFADEKVPRAAQTAEALGFSPLKSSRPDNVGVEKPFVET
jgi:hypothetical protein